MKLYEKISQLRRDAGLSQEALAERIGVSRQAVSKWECGEATPESTKLLALARHFGISVETLLDDEVDLGGTPDAENAGAPDSESSEQAPPPKAEPAPTQNDTLSRLPGFIEKLVRRFGWLVGVYVTIIGALFSGMGLLIKLVAASFVRSSVSSFESSMGAFDSAFAAAPGFSFSGSFDDAYFGGAIEDMYASQMKTMSQPMDIMANAVLIFGIVLLVGGIILTIFLRRKRNG